MAVSYEEAKELKDELEKEYQERHDAHRDLRDFYHGRYWQKAEPKGGLSSFFRDLRNQASEVGPDLKLVHNLIQEVVTKFQSFLSPLPMIQVYTDPPASSKRRQQATKKERFLYAQWWEGNMTQILNNAAWYLPLMGDCFLGAIPDLGNNRVTPILRSPEHAYPVPSFEKGRSTAVIFAWEIGERWAEREFDKYTPRRARNNGSRTKRFDQVEVLEYSDGNEWTRWIDGQRTHGVEHELGVNLYHQMKFIAVPDEPWGHGAVEQAVGMVEMGNALYSLMFQAVLENVFPRLILENPHKFPEEIDNGPGAVIGVNEGGKAYWLHPPTGLLPSQLGFLQENERAVKQATSMPDVNFGQFDASIITGKAISQLQGAGTGSVVEMVQGVGMGSVITLWNEIAIVVGQRMFRDESLALYGREYASAVEVKGKPFAERMKGAELVGSPRNEVVFGPYIDQHEKLVMGLQALSAGLVSKEHVRNQIGIPDTIAMADGIISEQLEEAVLAAIVMAVQQAGDPAAAQAAEANALGIIEGGGKASPAVAPPALLGMPQSLPALPPGAVPSGGQLPAAPPGPPPSAVGGPAAAPGPSPATPTAGEVILDQATTAFQQVEGIVGRVFLVGEIVQQGKTDEEIEVRVTEPDDRQTIVRGVPFDVDVRTVSAEPGEPHIEVTPGAEPLQQGEEPTADELFAEVVA